jgi:hypothetical protein
MGSMDSVDSVDLEGYFEKKEKFLDVFFFSGLRATDNANANANGYARPSKKVEKIFGGTLRKN